MIGIVGPSAEATGLAEAVDSVDVSIGDADDVVAADPLGVVAIGDSAASALVRAGVEVPVLPVDGSGGLDPIPRERAPAALRQFVESGLATCERSVLDVTVDGDSSGRALFDAMLVTSEPARISEFTVETSDGAERYRADGVVVATPAGSHGYARAVGGPVLDRDATSLAIVPVAAFAIRPTIRIASGDVGLTLRVERDEGEISLLVDGIPGGEVPAGRRVAVRVHDTVETVLPPSGGPW